MINCFHVKFLSLFEFLHTICFYSIDELPDGSDFEIIQYKAIKLIRYKIQTEIEQWCQEYHIEEMFSKRYDFFLKKCRLIEVTYRDIYQVIQGNKPPTAERNLPEDSDFNSNQSESLFSLLEKIVLFVHTLFYPWWFPIMSPLVFMNAVVEKMNINRFREDKMTHMLRWAEKEIENFSSKELYKFLQEAYLQKFMTIMEHVYDNIIPNKIESDRELIKNIVKETRDSETLKQEYVPIERNCKQIIGEILYAKLTYLTNQPCIKEVKNELGRGTYSTVSSCVVQICDREMQCAVKKMTSPLSREMYVQLTEVANMK